MKPEVYEPKIKKSRFALALIWLIPLVSAICVGIYVKRHFANRGSEITIHFADASGLRVGETRLLYRGAEIGEIDRIELSEDRRHAIVTARLYGQAGGSFANEGAAFWIVKPEVSASGLSGLTTIFSGPYIAALPGSGDPRKEAFDGFLRAPRPREDGRRFTLTARTMGHVQEGSAVSYKGIQVGTVESVALSAEADRLEIDIVVRTKYAPLVRVNSKFWVASGFQVDGGIFSGVSLKLDSIRTLTSGGIGFATPEEETGPAAKAQTVFPIEEKPDSEWASWSPRIPLSKPLASKTRDTQLSVSQSKAVRK